MRRRVFHCGYRAVAALAVLWAGAASGEPLTFECLVRPSLEIHVGTPINGIVASVDVDRGDWVAKGQVIARLDTRLQETAVRLAEARAGSTAELQAARARVTLLEKQLERNKQLKKGKYVADASVEEVEAELQVAVNEVRRAELTVEMAKIELSAARVEFERRLIKSPIDGYVVERHLVPGEYWKEETPIVTVAAVDPLYVETFADIKAHGAIAVGSAAVVRPEEPVGGRYEATVDVVDRVYDAASGTFGVRLVLPNPDRTLPAGIKCEVTFNGDS